MKKLLAFLVPIIGILLLYTIVWANERYDLFMPVVYDSRPPTATPTPAPTEEPTPTPTLTPVYTEDGYSWVFIGYAELEQGVVKVAGLKPGYCYDVVVDRYEQDGTLAVLKAKEIEEGYWWCTSPPYNPDAPWPPPQFPPPTEIPPDIFYGEIFKEIIPRSVKVVCGFGGLTNCFTVIR